MRMHRSVIKTQEIDSLQYQPFYWEKGCKRASELLCVLRLACVCHVCVFHVYVCHDSVCLVCVYHVCVRHVCVRHVCVCHVYGCVLVSLPLLTIGCSVICACADFWSKSLGSFFLSAGVLMQGSYDWHCFNCHWCELNT